MLTCALQIGFVLRKLLYLGVSKYLRRRKRILLFKVDASEHEQRLAHALSYFSRARHLSLSCRFIAGPGALGNMKIYESLLCLYHGLRDELPELCETPVKEVCVMRPRALALRHARFVRKHILVECAIRNTHCRVLRSCAQRDKDQEIA